MAITRFGRKVVVEVGIMGTRHDLRRQERRPCEHNVTVIWRDARGENKFAVARAIDISESGIRLQMPEAPPLHSYVTLRAAKLGLLGNASVRHCFRTAASRHVVGAEFSTGLQWTPDKPAAV
jgi:hypothetical protein